MKESKKGQFIRIVKETLASDSAYSEMTNICMSRPDNVSFADWVKQTDWSFAAIIAFFRYQCLYLNGDLDWQEFEDEFAIFKSKIYPCLD